MAVSSDNSGLLFETEVDDDAFYAEIRRQILQLTTEDDDVENSNNVGGFLGETKRSNNPIVSGRNGGGGDGSLLYQSGCGFPVGGSHIWTWEAQNCGGPPPVWLRNMWEKNGKGTGTGTGTGVFIPQAVVGCNKNPPRTGRTNSRRKTYKPVATKN